MNDLTLETFTENEKNKTTDKNKNKKTTEKKIINSEKKSKIKKEKKVDETKNTKKTLTASFMWEKLPYPVISTIEMNNDKSGFINIEFYETNDKCIGTIALNKNNEGSWSISCPDNPKRKGVFKKKLSASGTISVVSDKFVGIGYDIYKNKVKFISSTK